MHCTSGVPLGVQVPSTECLLLSVKNVEVVVRGVTTSVPLGANGRTKED